MNESKLSLVARIWLQESDVSIPLDKEIDLLVVDETSDDVEAASNDETEDKAETTVTVPNTKLAGGGSGYF